MLKRTIASRPLEPSEETEYRIATDPIVEAYLDIPHHRRNQDNPLFCRLEYDLRMIHIRMDLVWVRGQLRKIVV